MENSVFRKGLVIGIITVFILTNLTGCINENLIEFETIIKGSSCGHNESGN